MTTSKMATQDNHNLLSDLSCHLQQVCSIKVKERLHISYKKKQTILPMVVRFFGSCRHSPQRSSPNNVAFSRIYGYAIVFSNNHLFHRRTRTAYIYNACLA